MGIALIHDFAEVVTWTRFAPNYQVASVRYDADFVAGNVISMTINGVDIATVPFNGTQAQTLLDLASSIQLHGDVSSAVAVDLNREILITCIYAATELIINEMIVLGGLSQPEGVVFSRNGGYVDGTWHNASPTEIEIEMSVQPINGHELVQLPEGDRSREWVKGYTAVEMQIADEVNGVRGDWILWNNKNYEVQKSERWMITDLNHYKVLMAEVNVEYTATPPAEVV